jgi:hypothetical protein
MLPISDPIAAAATPDPGALLRWALAVEPQRVRPYVGDMVHRIFDPATLPAVLSAARRGDETELNAIDRALLGILGHWTSGTEPAPHSTLRVWDKEANGITILVRTARANLDQTIGQLSICLQAADAARLQLRRVIVANGIAGVAEMARRPDLQLISDADHILVSRLDRIARLGVPKLAQWRGEGGGRLLIADFSPDGVRVIHC